MVKLNAAETLNLISKQWAGISDIRALAEVGEGNARKIKKRIEEELKDWLLPYGKVPMSKVVEYLRIDIKYLKKVSEERK
jgi:hypothetical protein